MRVQTGEDTECPFCMSLFLSAALLYAMTTRMRMKEETNMKITIVGRQLNVYDDTRALIEAKLSKLDRYFPSSPDAETEATVTLSRRRDVSRVEVTLSAGGTLMRSEVDAPDFRTAMDGTLDNIQRQICKHKTRLQKRLREDLIPPAETLPRDGDVSEEDDDPRILRVKTYTVRPMNVEDAVLQMELLDHSFFVFRDAGSGETCVVYRRKDGGCGLLRPEN